MVSLPFRQAIAEFPDSRHGNVYEALLLKDALPDLFGAFVYPADYFGRDRRHPLKPSWRLTSSNGDGLGLLCTLVEQGH